MPLDRAPQACKTRLSLRLWGRGGCRASLFPPGLFGGHDGGTSTLLVKRKGESEFRSFREVFGVASPTKFTNVVLREGDELRYCTPGGAGYGNPREREPELVREDVLEGWVSRESAARDYAFEEDE